MINVEMTFKDFEKIEHLEEYIREHLVRAIEPFFGNNKTGNFLKVIISEDSRKRAAKPHIVCESILKTDGFSRPIVAKKSSYNFYESINKAAATLRKILHKKRAQQRNHHTSSSRERLVWNVPGGGL